jgi:hypothetical protein
MLSGRMLDFVNRKEGKKDVEAAGREREEDGFKG